MALLLAALLTLSVPLWGIEHCLITYDGISGHLGLLKCKGLYSKSTYRVVLKNNSSERCFTYYHPKGVDYLPFAVPRWWSGNVYLYLYRDGYLLAKVPLRVEKLKVRASRIRLPLAKRTRKGKKEENTFGRKKWEPNRNGNENTYPSVRKLLKTYTPVRFYEKRAILPLEHYKYITTPFGAERYINGVYRGFHKGVDFAAPRGTPVRAILSGKVLYAGWMPLTGKTVILDHGWGLMSLYAHLSEVDVKRGQSVRRGEVIGKVGSTGRSTGPHLHLGVYLNDTAVDPLGVMELRLRP